MASIFVTKFIGASVAQFTWASAIIQHFHSPNWMNKGLGSTRTFRANIWDQKGNPCTSNLIINNSSSNTKAHTHPNGGESIHFSAPTQFQGLYYCRPQFIKKCLGHTLQIDRSSWCRNKSKLPFRCPTRRTCWSWAVVQSTAQTRAPKSPWWYGGDAAAAGPACICLIGSREWC